MKRLVPLIALAGFVSSAGADPLEDRVEVLAEEVRRLKEQIAIPETQEELESFGGLGPAASKVYSKTSGLSLGGYGEFYFAAPTGAAESVRTADLYRFITYVGYKFTDRVLMNTEIEFEHATTSSNQDDRSGSVSVEFSYLDFLIRDEVNVRAGNLLVPMGFVNEMHEPPYYRGNFRPAVERSIIPSTWRELGAGLHGELSDRVGYKLYLVNGLDAAGFDETGIRGGRQKGNRARWEDVAGVASVEVRAAATLSVGGSVFVGGADQGRSFDGMDAKVTTTVAEGHLELRRGPWTGRALVAGTSIDGAGEISGGAGPVIPESQLGWYLEAAWDAAGLLGLPGGMSLAPWGRWESLELQRAVPEGFSPDESLNGSLVTIGLEWKPEPSVVVKADLTLERPDGGGSTEDPFRIGAGFVF